ncbi:hypothetical protein DM01DRAFT_1332379 [Hesseltinella vesiculosa]|uniref:RecQ-mediated genome instability protein 1 n=1 Tax=Hesseltinella vesiculosa TaxID=101127 RepID=A0A1X2GUU9_9FUNG|nr:hypothetical protein DM01DRAFT_1332379 [Hesseltinella vesiculosa]
MPPSNVLTQFEQNGIRIRPNFYEQWERDTPNAEYLTAKQKYDHLFDHFLTDDIGKSCLPCLDPNKRLPSKLILQIQDVTDTSNSLYSLVKSIETDPDNLARGRLKWTMTDGQREIFVYELEQIPNISLTTPFGTKVVIHSALYANGLLLVKPSQFQVLGGKVQSLFGDSMEQELLRRFKFKLESQNSSASIPNSNASSTSIYPPVSTLPLSTTTAAPRAPAIFSSSPVIVDLLDEDDDGSMFYDDIPEEALVGMEVSLSYRNENALPSATDPPPSSYFQSQHDATMEQLEYGLDAIHTSQDPWELSDDDMADFTLDQLGHPIDPAPSARRVLFHELQNMVKSLNDNEHHFQDDRVVVRVDCTHFKTLRVLKNNCFAIMDLVHGGQNVTACVSGKVLKDYLQGYSLEDVFKIWREQGPAVAGVKIIKPMTDILHQSPADLEIDFSVLEKQEKVGVLPEITKYDLIRK